MLELDRLYYYPGFPSISTAYFGVNDFYYSGHVGLCTILMYEMIASKENKLFPLNLFVLAYEWIGMTLT